MDRSPQLRVYLIRLDALLTLGFPSAPGRKPLTLPYKVTRRLIMQKARCQAYSKLHCSPTACKCMVSGTLSLPYYGYFSLSAHATGSLPVVNEYLALGGGPPGFKPGSTCPVLLGYVSIEIPRLSHKGLSPSLVPLSNGFR